MMSKNVRWSGRITAVFAVAAVVSALYTLFVTPAGVGPVLAVAAWLIALALLEFSFIPSLSWKRTAHMHSAVVWSFVAALVWLVLYMWNLFSIAGIW